MSLGSSVFFSSIHCLLLKVQNLENGPPRTAEWLRVEDGWFQHHGAVALPSLIVTNTRHPCSNLAKSPTLPMNIMTSNYVLWSLILMWEKKSPRANSRSYVDHGSEVKCGFESNFHTHITEPHLQEWGTYFSSPVWGSQGIMRAHFQRRWSTGIQLGMFLFILSASSLLLFCF